MLMQSISVRAVNPIKNPYDIHNVRAVRIVPNQNGRYVVTGTEDGGLTIVDIEDASVVEQITFNQKAQRGINDVQMVNDLIFVGVCSVGKDDYNSWLYKLAKMGQNSQ
eukprot:UN18113